MILRRLKGVGVAAVLWGILWLPFGIGGGILEYARLEPFDAPIYDGKNWSMGKPPLLPFLGRWAVMWAVWGAVVGVVFATSMLIAERNRSLNELSAARFAAWGGFAAMLLPGFLIGVSAFIDRSFSIMPWQVFALLLFTGIYGAACSAGMLRLARRAGAT